MLQATVVKQTLEKRRSVGRSSSFSGVRSPRDRPRSIRFEPKTIEERVLEKKSLTDEEVAPPSDFKVTRRVGDDGLVVAWIPPPDFDAICGYIVGFFFILLYCKRIQSVGTLIYILEN